MPDDGVTREDVRHVLASGARIEIQNDTGTKWKVTGPIVDGSDYAVVVIIRENGTMHVKTCHLPPRGAPSRRSRSR